MKNLKLHLNLILLVILVFSGQNLFAQDDVSDKINQILLELVDESNVVNSLIKLHDLKKPDLTREKLKTEYDSIANLIIDQKYNAKDSASVYNRRNELLNILGEITKWETERARLLNRKQNISKQIIQYSAIIDLSESTEALRNQIDSAEVYNEQYNRDVIVSFAASVRHIRDQAYSELAYNSLSESMVIFEPGTNEKALDWLKNGMNILGIAGGVAAYSGFDNDNQVAGISSIAVTSLIYLVGQKIITNKKNNDSEVQKSFEALSRNVLYGNIIREDSTNLAKFKANSDSLLNLIPYLPNNDAGEVDKDWEPSAKVISRGHLLLSCMENSLVFWNQIILASSDMLLNTNDFLTTDGRKNLKENISRAESLISVREDNISRFRSKLYYLEKQYSENVKETN